MKIEHPIVWLESKPKLAWTLTVLYAFFIFLMSAFPYMPPQPSALKPVSATFKHVLEFSVFGFLLLASFRSNAKTKKFAFWFAIFSAAFYGMTDEFHQLFVVGRTASIADALADAAGGFLGSLFASPKLFRMMPKP